MNPNLDIVVILTVGFVLASVFAYVTQLLKLSPIPGYLLAGYVIGPYSPGYVADSVVAEQLAEIGVILMLFGVGLHFKLEDLNKVKNIAIPGATGQIILATFVSTLLVVLAGWPLETGLIIGLAIGVASTVVLVHVLQDNHLLNTLEGHVAVGWLVVEDLFTVILLILLPTFAGLSEEIGFTFFNITQAIVLVCFQLTFLVLFMFTFGHKIVAFLLTSVVRAQSRELFTLAVIALTLLIAAGSTFLFGTSIGLGAFIAGMVIGKTRVKHQAAAQSLPIKDLFSIIFFLSVGMIFNPVALGHHFWLFLGLLGVVLIVKPLSAYIITLVLGYPLRVALTLALALAQIGEFSFILAEQSLKLNLLPEDGYDLLVGCALISISLNPFLFSFLDYFEAGLKKLSFFSSTKNETLGISNVNTTVLPKAVIVGFGTIGKAVSAILHNSEIPLIIIEQNIDTVTNHKHSPIIFGDAGDANILKESHLEGALYLFITLSNPAKGIEIIHVARQMNPEILIICRVDKMSDRRLLEDLDVEVVCNEKESLEAYTSKAWRILNPFAERNARNYN
jgi:CPA2 family monovalent cation:H+ antiporter-2